MAHGSAARIGVFDSGVGGLGVWRHVVRALPGVPTTYLADQAYAPYGTRSLEEVRARSAEVVGMLLADGAALVVVACNTASAAALGHLRAAYPSVPFVGMEPALKPAAAATRSGVVGVLATRATLAAPGFRALVERHGGAARVVTRAGEGWVEAVEAGETEGPRVAALVDAAVAPLVAAGADHLVLGCTHFPFLAEPIGAAAGPGVRVVDPAPAVARRAAAVWSHLAPSASGGYAMAPHRVRTTGDPARFRALCARLVPEALDALAGASDA